jgi:hypothetical protein
LSVPNSWRPTSIATGSDRLGAANLAGAARNETPITTPAHSRRSAASAIGARPTSLALVSPSEAIIGAAPRDAMRSI